MNHGRWVIHWRFCIIALFLVLLSPFAASADLEAHFLDVGHGDCTILISDGEAAIIDGGPVSASQMVFSYLRSLGVTEIKYAFATHPQTDHVGGLPSAFHAAKVHALYTPVTEYANDRFHVLMDKAAEMNVPVIVPAVGDTLPLGDSVITILSPSRDYRDPNDLSLVLRVDSPGLSILLCGDATQTVEHELVRSGQPLRADVIRVSHHGSDDATALEFLSAVQPRCAVISCSERYDNPDPDTMARLLSSGATTLCTDYVGTIVITPDTLTQGLHDPVRCDRWYVGNLSSGVYHRHTCSSVSRMRLVNQQPLYSREEALRHDFTPCKNCSP